MNAELQRIARRDKKAFLSEQCKELEGNNRMGKIRDLFKKIRNTKGTFHKKMGTIKDRNGMDLTEAEHIKKRWQEYTEERSKTELHGVAKSRTRLINFTLTFHFHALEKEMATHSSVLAWRIPGTGEPGGLLSMGSHRVGHN